MFKGLGNFANVLKEVQQIQGRAAEMQDKLGRLKLEGKAGGEMVVVEVNGLQKVLAVRIEDSLLKADDKELLEDLVLSATNQALEKAREAAANEMSQIAGGLQMPGLTEMMNKFGLGGGSEGMA